MGANTVSTTPIAAGGVRNQILAGLPASDLDAQRPHLHRVTLSSGQILYETSSPILEVFFVEEGIVSLTADTSDNGQVEVGLTGREGFALWISSVSTWRRQRSRSSADRSRAGRNAAAVMR